MLTKVNLPPGGFQDGDDGPRLMSLEVAIGERTDTTTELFVRGKVAKPSKRWDWFAGTTIVREGRDNVDHDLVIAGPSAKMFVDRVAVAVHLALDEHATELLEAEMARICGE